MSDRDVAIGQNLTRLRGDKTQQDIADAMRAAGYKWSQATVWSVEKGERPLRLAEAESLAEFLGMSVDSFTKTESAVRLAVANNHMHGTYEQLRSVVNDFFEAQVLLAITADSTEAEQGLDGIPKMAVESWLTTSPENVCNEVRASREGEAMAERVMHARAEGFADVYEMREADLADGGESDSNDQAGPYTRMFLETYNGQHPEA